MTPTTPLKLCAIAFTVLWSGWMLWSSGAYDPANIIIWAVCGSVVGYLWYRMMRWCFRRMNLPPGNGAGPGATP